MLGWDKPHSATWQNFGGHRDQPGSHPAIRRGKASARRETAGTPSGALSSAPVFGTQPHGGDADGQRRVDILVQRITDIREVRRPHPPFGHGLLLQASKHGVQGRGLAPGRPPGRPTPALGQGSEGRLTRPARRRAGPCCWPCRDRSKAGLPAGCCRRHRWRGR